MSGPDLSKANHRHIYQRKKLKDLSSTWVREPQEEIDDPLTAELYRAPDMDEESYAFHLAELKMVLGEAKKSKRKAAYEAEENRTKELSKIQHRLDFIKDFFLGIHDGYPPALDAPMVKDEEHKERLSSQGELRPEKGTGDVAEVIYKYANKLMRTNGQLPSANDLWAYMAENGKPDVELNGMNELKFRDGVTVSKHAYRARYKRYFKKQ